MVSGRRTEGKGRMEEGVYYYYFFIFPKNPGPIFFVTSPKKGKTILDSS